MLSKNHYQIIPVLASSLIFIKVWFGIPLQQGVNGFHPLVWRDLLVSIKHRKSFINYRKVVKYLLTFLASRMVIDQGPSWKLCGVFSSYQEAVVWMLRKAMSFLKDWAWDRLFVNLCRMFSQLIMIYRGSDRRSMFSKESLNFLVRWYQI